jgi:hypothetical protein
MIHIKDPRRAARCAYVAGRLGINYELITEALGSKDGFQAVTARKPELIHPLTEAQHLIERSPS